MQNRILSPLGGKIGPLIRQLDRATGGTLSVLRMGFRGYQEGRTGESAASIAYYAMFSLFPLLLVAVAFGSVALESEQARARVLTLISQVIPVSSELIESNIDQVLKERGTVGLVGGISLLWSASGVFTAVVHQINRAWGAEPRGFLVRRVLALGVVGLLSLALLALWLFSNSLLNLLPYLNIGAGQGGAIFESLLWQVSSRLVPLLLLLLLFLLLYRWVPNRRVAWLEAFWGALVAGLGLNLVTGLFSRYLRSGLANYNLVYGSLGTVVALMFWIYLCGLIVLFGAHLGAAVSRYRAGERPGLG